MARRSMWHSGRDNAVGVVDVATRTMTDKIPCGTDPEQVAVSP